MSRVTIVGGGLTGILAAFEAHRLGLGDIHLHERFDDLGGVARADVRHGVELREGCVYFGQPGDPIRDRLEAYGVAFEDFDNRFGAVSPTRDGQARWVEDFGGPVLDGSSLSIMPPGGASLADRLAAYSGELRGPLEAYVRWHLGPELNDLHASAAVPLAINRVFPLGADLSALAALKRSDALADALFAIPRSLWGRTDNLTAATPEGGFAAMFETCRRSLRDLGVTLHTGDLISPRHALLTHRPGEVLVWAASPTPLFKAAGLPTPRALPKRFATYVYGVDWSGPCPFYVQNFTATGACFRAYIYSSGGRTLLTAECVAEVGDADLRVEVARLLSGFEGQLKVGQMLAATVKPRWIYHTLEAIAGLVQLRATLAERFGPDFVCGAWEPYAKAEKFAEINAALAATLGPAEAAAAA